MNNMKLNGMTSNRNCLKSRFYLLPKGKFYMSFRAHEKAGIGSNKIIKYYEALICKIKSMCIRWVYAFTIKE